MYLHTYKLFIPSQEASKVIFQLSKETYPSVLSDCT